MLFCRLLIFFKIKFFEKFFQEYHQNIKQFGYRSGPTFVGPDLGPNCLQFKLSTNDTSRQRVKITEFNFGLGLCCQCTTKSGSR